MEKLKLPLSDESAESLKDKLFNMIDGNPSEKPLMLTIEFHSKNQKRQFKSDNIILDHLARP